MTAKRKPRKPKTPNEIERQRDRRRKRAPDRPARLPGKNPGGTPIDLTGQVFGLLTALKLLPRKSDSTHRYWECKCHCGKKHVVRSSHLRCGSVTSCRQLDCTAVVYDGDPQQMQIPGIEIPPTELAGVCECRSFSVSTSTINTVLIFEIGVIDLAILRQFPQAKGTLKINLAAEVTQRKEVPA